MKVFISYNKKPPKIEINHFLEGENLVLKTPLDILGEKIEKNVSIEPFNFSNRVYLAHV